MLLAAGSKNSSRLHLSKSPLSAWHSPRPSKVPLNPILSISKVLFATTMSGIKYELCWVWPKLKKQRPNHVCRSELAKQLQQMWRKKAYKICVSNTRCYHSILYIGNMLSGCTEGGRGQDGENEGWKVEAVWACQYFPSSGSACQKWNQP